MTKKLDQYLKDPLYKNSFFITLSRFLNVAVGFIFWIVAAKMYSVEDVGIATVLLSSLNIVTSFSRFGFDFSLIRFIRLNDKAKVFNTSLVITTTGSIIIGFIYIFIINYFSPNLSFVQRPGYAAIFLFFVAMSSIVSITGVAFTAIRKADHYFYQNIMLSSRVPLLFIFVSLGNFGIFGSLGLAYAFSAIFSILYLKKNIRFDLKIDNQFVKDSINFSSGNYISNIFLVAPTLFLPILVLSLLGEAETGRYYMTFAIGTLVMIIPEALCMSLFIEGSHGESLRRNTIRTGLVIYSLLIPAILLIYLFGGYILDLIGDDYGRNFELLRLFAITCLFVPICSIFISIQNVRMNVASIIKLNFITFLLVSGLSYFLMLKFKILGIGYAFIIAYLILDLIIIVFIKKWKIL